MLHSVFRKKNFSCFNDNVVLKQKINYIKNFTELKMFQFVCNV